jgi:hypothetical protein
VDRSAKTGGTMNGASGNIKWLRRASGLFFFLLISGFEPLAVRYGVFSQWVLLMHIAVGLLAIVPLSVLFVRHGRAANLSNETRWWSVGLWSGIGWVVLCVSGVWLVSKGIWGVFTPYRAHIIHLSAGIFVAAIALFHICFGLQKSSMKESRLRELARPLTIWLAVLAVGGVALWISRAPRNLETADFHPSNARSATGRVVPAELLTGSESCGASGCHTEIYRQWQPSAHRYSALDPFFETVKANYITDRGPLAPRYCAGCHEPVALLAGASFHPHVEDAGIEGSSCAFCHSLRDTETHGNANYVVHPPDPYLFESSPRPVLRRVAGLLIRLHPEQHDRDYDVKASETAEFCGSCHKQFINREENGWGFVQLQNQYDGWKNGPWHTDSSKNLECQDCHMHEIAADDPGRNAHGFIHDHRILAANNYVPNILSLPGAAEQTRLVDNWLAGETVIPEIQKVWPGGPILPLHLFAQNSYRPGQQAELRVLVTNLKVGHEFPTGPLDVMQAWLELQVADARGNSIYSAGMLNAHGEIVGDTVQYRSHLMDKDAHPIFTHALWNAVATQRKRVILPGGSDTAVFRFKIPSGTVGPLQCQARLLYRRFSAESQAALFPPVDPPHIPVVEISRTSLQVPLSGMRQTVRTEAPVAKTAPGANRP